MSGVVNMSFTGYAPKHFKNKRDTDKWASKAAKWLEKISYKDWKLELYVRELSVDLNIVYIAPNNFGPYPTSEVIRSSLDDVYGTSFSYSATRPSFLSVTQQYSSGVQVVSMRHLPYALSEAEFVAFVRGSCFLMQTHEFDEAFKLNGSCINNPHEKNDNPVVGNFDVSEESVKMIEELLR